MKRLVCALAAILTAGLAPASAQVVHTPLQFTIETSFYVGDKLMPAGPYEVLPVFGDQNLLEVKSLGKGGGAYVWTREKANPERPASSELTFNQYGDELFLNSVVVQEGWDAAVAVESRAERRAMVVTGLSARIVVPAVPARRKS
jgi:hypothetical protein